MRTRSQARKHRQQQVRQTSVESPNLEKPNNNPPIVTMADNRTMAQLLEAPTEGYEDAIVVHEYYREQFEICLVYLISSSDVAELKDMVRAFVLDKTKPSYSSHSSTNGNIYRDNIQEYVSQAAAANFNQGNSGYRPPPMANQIRPPGFPPMQHNNQANNQNPLEHNQIKTVGRLINRVKPTTTALSIAIRGELKAITTRSGVSYDGPQIPPPVVEVETEVTKDTVLPNGSTKDVQPPIVQVDEPVVMPRAKTTLPYPSRILGFSELLVNENSTPSFEQIVDTILPPHSFEGIDDAECDLKKDILLLEAILNSEPLPPLPNHANYFPEVRKELKICEAKTNETSIDEPSEVELKDCPPTSYMIFGGNNKLPVIIA
ncbi:hypothetical protein Tco_1475676 [Tanacetum coccineum]